MENNTIVNHDWLQVVADHPAMTDEDLLAAYHHLGVPTDRTPEQIDASTFKLQLLGVPECWSTSATTEYLHLLAEPPLGTAMTLTENCTPT